MHPLVSNDDVRRSARAGLYAVASWKLALITSCSCMLLDPEAKAGRRQDSMPSCPCGVGTTPRTFGPERVHLSRTEVSVWEVVPHGPQTTSTSVKYMPSGYH